MVNIVLNGCGANDMSPFGIQVPLEQAVMHIHVAVGRKEHLNCSVLHWGNMTFPQS